MGTTVYVGRLPYGVRESDLEKFFNGYLPLRNIVLKKGYGFVEFDDPRDADDAANYLNNRELCGEKVTVELAKGAPKTRDETGGTGSKYPSGRLGHARRHNGRRRSPSYSTRWRVRVENLSTGVSWKDLKDFMREVAAVTYADAHSKRDREGTVCFATEHDMYRALNKLDGTFLNGRRIRLFNESKPSSRSPSRSRSRSASRSRSRSPVGNYVRERRPPPSPGRLRSSYRSRSRSKSASITDDERSSNSSVVYRYEGVKPAKVCSIRQTSDSSSSSSRSKSR